MPPASHGFPDPIRHVVLLLLENRSFDQMLGCFTAVYPHLDGVHPDRPGANDDGAGHVYHQMPTTMQQMRLDPKHEPANVRAQIAGGNAGFVRDFVMTYPNSTIQDRQ